MPQKPETKIVTSILKWLISKGGDGYHVHGSNLQRAGEPDIDGSYYSLYLEQWLHLKLEVKTATGKPSKLQVFRIREYHKRGYVAGVVTSVGETDRLIRDWEGWQRYFATQSFAEYLEGQGVSDDYDLY